MAVGCTGAVCQGFASRQEEELRLCHSARDLTVTLRKGLAISAPRHSEDAGIVRHGRPVGACEKCSGSASAQGARDGAQKGRALFTLGMPVYACAFCRSRPRPRVLPGVESKEQGTPLS